PMAETMAPDAVQVEAAWQWLAAVAGDVLWSGQGRDVANLVWAFAAAGRSEPQVFGNLITALSHPRRGPALASELREEECTVVLWAVAAALERQQEGGGGGGGGGAVSVEFARTAATSLATAAAGTGRDVFSPPSPPLPPTAAAGRAVAVGPEQASKVVAHLGPRAAHLALHGKLTGRQIGSMLKSLVVVKASTGIELDSDWLQALALRVGHKARYMDG
ncbi:hypothetical protein Vretimale_1398, partial [Volvox reticuliferus]